MTAPIENNELREAIKAIPYYQFDSEVVDEVMQLVDAHTARKETEVRLDELRTPYSNGMFNKMGDAYYHKRQTELEQKLKESSREEAI